MSDDRITSTCTKCGSVIRDKVQFLCDSYLLPLIKKGQEWQRLENARQAVVRARKKLE